MRLIRFHYERRYKRRGILIESRWWLVRFYPPVLPSWSWWWKSRQKRKWLDRWEAEIAEYQKEI